MDCPIDVAIESADLDNKNPPNSSDNIISAETRKQNITEVPHAEITDNIETFSLDLYKTNDTHIDKDGHSTNNNKLHRSNIKINNADDENENLQCDIINNIGEVVLMKSQLEEIGENKCSFSIDNGDLHSDSNIITDTTIDFENESITRKRTSISDDDSCNYDNVTSRNDVEAVPKKKGVALYKKRNVIDSDSDEEKVTYNETPKTANEDEEKEEATHNYRVHCLAVCDPETSSDEEQQDHLASLSDSEKTVSKTNVKKRRVKPTHTDEGVKKITGRDALKLRKEIQSESQRMTREASLKLPYHKPKSRTLKEFLTNRMRFTATIPTTNTPPSLAIKMSTDQLKAISEKLSEREKMFTQFFKSESESEEEDGEAGTTECHTTENKESESTELNTQTQRGIHILQDIVLNPTVDNTKEQSQASNINENNTDGKCDVVYVKERQHQLNYSNENTSGTQSLNSNPSVDESLLPDVSESDPSMFVVIKNICSQDEDQNTNTAEEHGREVHQSSSEKDDQFVDGRSDFIQEDKQEEEPQNVQNLVSKYKIDELVEKYLTSETHNECDVDDVNDGAESKQKNVSSVLDLVKSKFGDFKPQLKGHSDEIIDLEDGTIKLNEVNRLMNRFIQHTKKKSPQKQKVKLDVISLSSGEIHKETVEMEVNNEESIPINEKPGERLKRLREELQLEMAKRRSELWQQKSNIKTGDQDKTEEEDDEKTDYEKEAWDMLDDENEEEFTESENEGDIADDDGDDEDNDGDYDKKENAREKNVFLDEEAEESDIDKDDVDQETNENEDESESEAGYCAEDVVTDDESPKSGLEVQKKKKRLKRIIKPFSNESDDEESNSEADLTETNIVKTANTEQNKNNQMDSTDTLDECSLTPYQPRNSHTPVRKRTQSKSELGFLTPVQQLTGLQSLNSDLLREMAASPVIPSDLSPLKSLTQNASEEGLLDSTDLATSQELSKVAELCSGTFLSQSQTMQNQVKYTEDDLDADRNCETSNQDTPSTQDLVEICSGNFTGITQVGEVNKEAAEELKEDTPSTQDLLEICSGKFTGITQINKISAETIEEKCDETNTGLTSDSSQIVLNSKEIKSLDNEDKLLTELLNDEEMENFKKTFESADIASLTAVNRIIYDSSEDEDEDSPKKNSKKQRRKLVFSDEDDSDRDAEVAELEEDIDLCDDVDDEQDKAESVREVDYDSEENEIEIEKPERLKVTDFVENEAELSESEWGSADEDEKDLDEFEREEGDEEKLDDEQVKRDLERIHMRRILDDDNQEVKLLQELLLDDGEMHGDGRERQFRWKNIDSLGLEGNDNNQDDGEIYIDEDEDEEKWRKMRYEREVFLKKQLEKTVSLEIEDDLLTKTDSQIIKLGQASIRRNTPNCHNVSEEINKVKVAEPTSLLSKRGSFLSRSDEVLQRVAIFTKTVTSATVGNAKSSRNFVFQTVSETTENSLWSKKRKATEGTPNAIKKLRLNNASPSVQKKEKSSKAKKLFSVW